LFVVSEQPRGTVSGIVEEWNDSNFMGNTEKGGKRDIGGKIRVVSAHKMDTSVVREIFWASQAGSGQRESATAAGEG
jgi:hypothetical protein